MILSTLAMYFNSICCFRQLCSLYLNRKIQMLLKYLASENSSQVPKGKNIHSLSKCRIFNIKNSKTAMKRFQVIREHLNASRHNY